jgi:acyl-CoA oxidase
MSYSLPMIIKMGVGVTLAIKTITNLGTMQHMKYAKDIFKFKEIGCFALTELGHGSNVKGIETTATFDKVKQEYVINTPNEKAMKFWIGGAAKTSTICVIWAQLIIDGKGYGVHAFVS